MDIRQLKYFLTIVDEGSISKAANKLHMTQPPLSQKLKLLEDELGVSLLERTTKKLVMTEAGRLLYDRAQDIMERLNGTAEEIKELSEGITGTLTIGTIASLGSELLLKGIQHFQKHYPNVTFQVHEGDPNRIMELSKNRDVELGIVRLPVDSDVFDMIHLPSEPMYAAMNHKWNETSQCDITLSQLKDKPLLLLKRYPGTSTYNQKMYTMEMVKEACNKAGFNPHIIGESTSLTMLLNWAYHGIGVVIVPKSAMNVLPTSELVYKKITHPSIESRPSGLIWLKHRHLSTPAKRFIDYIASTTF
ncbi:DNA-binding transcriptional regulator, LysR family [Alteribacillus persepolensis]|uniref:DNA-binding transcriptional regulator, LysR family n=2 Tax=Alteribacillus persepolensis TaxID=568899 RepID=A0A1G8AL86_9BACI|nr:DNA-binding transcriptional regulator, LysR family [Alteribacillus persepolensis]